MIKKSAVRLLFMLFLYCSQMSFAQSADTGQLALANPTHSLVLKNANNNKIVQIKRGDKVRIFLSPGNLKGTFFQFSKDSMGIYSGKYGIRYIHINEVKKIKVLNSTGVVMIGSLFRFSGIVGYAFGAFYLTVGTLGAINGDMSSLLIAFVPPLVTYGLASTELGKTIQGKTYRLHSKWAAQ